MKTSRFNQLAASSVFLCALSHSLGADLTKADNDDAFNSPTSWVQNVAPGSSDTLVWDNTVTSARLITANNGGFYGGVRILDPGGTVSFRVSSNGTTTWSNNALIDMSLAARDAVWSAGTMRIASGNFSPTFDVAANRTLTLDGGLSNQGNTKTFTFAGAGDVVINSNSGGGGAMNFNVNGAKVTMNNAASSWTFGTVTSGSLVLGNSTVLDGKRITVNGADGLAFAAGVTSASLGGLEGSGGFALTNADTNAVALTIGGNNASASQSGILSGAGSLTKVGAGTQTLSGANSFAGGLFLNAGEITFGNSNAAAGGTVTAANGTGLNLANSSSVFLDGTVAVSGAGSNVTLSSGNISAGFSTAFIGAADQTITISGSNQVNIASNSQQFGGLDGTVAVAGGSTLRFSSSSLNNGGGNTTFELAGNLITRNNGFLTLGALSGNGNISMGGSGGNGGQLFLTVGAKGIDTNYGGSISDADAGNGKIVNVTKTGAGIQTFSGISTYTGATTVTGGTLKLSAAGSIDHTSGISLATGGTLDVSEKGGYTVKRITGAGDVLGAITVSTELAIGNSPGTANFNSDLTLAAASTYMYELNGGGIAADLGNVDGKLTFETGATLDLVQLATYTPGDRFTLFSYSGTLTGEFDGLADDATFTAGGGDWRIDYNDTVAGLNGGIFSNFVTVTALVPEPGTALLSGLGMMLLLRRRRAS